MLIIRQSRRTIARSALALAATAALVQSPVAAQQKKPLAPDGLSTKPFVRDPRIAVEVCRKQVWRRVVAGVNRGRAELKMEIARCAEEKRVGRNIAVRPGCSRAPAVKAVAA